MCRMKFCHHEIGDNFYLSLVIELKSLIIVELRARKNHFETTGGFESVFVEA